MALLMSGLVNIMRDSVADLGGESKGTAGENQNIYIVFTFKGTKSDRSFLGQSSELEGKRCRTELLTSPPLSQLCCEGTGAAL